MHFTFSFVSSSEVSVFLFLKGIFLQSSARIMSNKKYRKRKGKGTSKIYIYIYNRVLIRHVLWCYIEYKSLAVADQYRLYIVEPPIHKNNFCT